MKTHRICEPPEILDDPRHKFSGICQNISSAYLRLLDVSLDLRLILQLKPMSAPRRDVQVQVPELAISKCSFVK